MSAWAIVKRTVLGYPGLVSTELLQAGMLSDGRRCTYQVHAIHESGVRIPPGPNPFQSKAARDVEAERLSLLVK